MTRSVLWLLMLPISIAASGWVLAQSNGAGVLRPLDLPSGGEGGDDDEVGPETVQFYGSEFEGDAFFWCLDRSCSMGTEDRIETLKREMAEAISQLSDRTEFGIVAFSGGYVSWSPIPMEANPSSKVSATAFVHSLSADGPTCLAAAGVTTIALSNQCDKERKQIIVLSDGEPNCPGPPETLAAMSSANWQLTPIHTIYLGSDADGIAFMYQLAAMNGGTCSTPGE